MTNQVEQQIPHNLLAEKQLLGLILRKPELFDIALGMQLKKDDFDAERNRLVFQSFSEVEEIDQFTVGEWLESHPLRSGAVITTEEVGFLIDDCDLPESYLSQTIRTLHKYTLRRKALVISEKLHSCMTNPDGEDISESINGAIDELQELTLINKEVFVGLTKVAFDEMKRAESDAPLSSKTVTTGFANLDKFFPMGIEAGSLNIIGARPGQGKTALALNIVSNIAQTATLPILIFSLEMTAENLAQRVVSSFAKDSFLNIKEFGTTQWADVMKGLDSLRFDDESDKILIDTSADVTPSKIRARSKHIASLAGGLSAIFVDHMHLMRADSSYRFSNQTAEISEISRALKIMAKDLNCPVFALAQLNRQLESRQKDTAPMLSDLRGSGSIEQDADRVLLLHRKGQEETTSVKIAKNRNGRTGDTFLKFVGRQSRFWDVEDRNNGYSA